MTEPSASFLHRWPIAARVDSRVPKEKFYEHGNVPTSIREKFISDIQRIIWRYKLAETTVNLKGSVEVPEIQVFQIDAKSRDVGEPVLTAIDKAIPHPIIFEITRDVIGEQQVRMVAAHKRVGAGATQLSTYFTTGWLPANIERQPLPTAITLPALYSALLGPLTPVQVRPGEEMSEVAVRLTIVRKLEREIAALERKLRTEPQFNRKIELRRALKTKQQELEQQR